MIASRCNQIGTCMCNFKTVHENKVLINTPIIESIVDKMQVPQLLNNMKMYILSLDRYQCVNGELVDNELIEALDGKYIKLEDVLKLFGAEK